MTVLGELHGLGTLTLDDTHYAEVEYHIVVRRDWADRVIAEGMLSADSRILFNLFTTENGGILRLEDGGEMRIVLRDHAVGTEFGDIKVDGPVPGFPD